YKTGAPATEPPAKQPAEKAETEGLLDVDLSDDWAPFIFSEGALDESPDAAGTAIKKPAKPKPAKAGDGGAIDLPANPYRKPFIELANERVNADGIKPKKNAPHEHNYLEPFGIPPTLTVLLAHIEDDLQPERQACYA